MDFTTLGRTGLRVSRVGLGCGGHSRLGLATGKDEANAIAVVREALALGINFFDTAESYGTETALGKGLARVARDTVFVSTKLSPYFEDRLTTPEELKTRAEGCLQRLQTDYVDILHLHGVKSEAYPYCKEVLYPALQELQQSGKIRHIGITEAFGPDPEHAMLAPAVQNDNLWEVVMVGFNVLNPSARERVLVATQAKQIGTLCMFAVRRALSNPEALNALLNGLIAEGKLPEDARTVLPLDDRTGIAYRFCRDEPGLDVILTGTGSVDHLRENVAALHAPPLDPSLRARLTAVFATLDCVSGN